MNWKGRGTPTPLPQTVLVGPFSRLPCSLGFRSYLVVLSGFDSVIVNNVFDGETRGRYIDGSVTCDMYVIGFWKVTGCGCNHEGKTSFSLTQESH